MYCESINCHNEVYKVKTRGMRICSRCKQRKNYSWYCRGGCGKIFTNSSNLSNKERCKECDYKRKKMLFKERYYRLHPDSGRNKMSKKTLEILECVKNYPRVYNVIEKITRKDKKTSNVTYPISKLLMMKYITKNKYREYSITPLGKSVLKEFNPVP